jgi:hypothetical protein
MNMQAQLATQTSSQENLKQKEKDLVRDFFADD